MADEKISAVWAEDDGGVIGYMCLTDWEVELGGAMGGNTVHPTPDEVKCGPGCGVVEVRVYFSRLVSPPEERDDFGNAIRKGEA